MLADVPVPRAEAGQIQLRIAAASINPGDIVVPSGEFRDTAPLAFPQVPGNDFAGTVSAVGPGVTRWKAGDEVFGMALPLMATANVQPGERVLVVGATGGVGTTVIPLLVAAKTEVIATATAGDADVLRGLGADTTIGYGAYPSDVDVVLNLTLPGDRLAEVAGTLRPGGRTLNITFPPADTVRVDIDVRFVLDMEGRYGGMAEVAGLQATVGRRYDLDQGPQACVDFARRHTTGKLVVAVAT